jgi:hypothetical protein
VVRLLAPGVLAGDPMSLAQRTGLTHTLGKMLTGSDIAVRRLGG